MHGVAIDALGIAGAQGAGQGLFRVGGAHDFAVLGDGAFGFQHLDDDRLGDHLADLQGDICATGDVLIDQLVHMHRSGYTSAVLAEGVRADAAQRQIERFTAFYQGDVLQQRPLFARQAAELELA